MRKLVLMFAMTGKRLVQFSSVSVLCGLILIGCGGGGGGLRTTQVKYTLGWGARSRAIEGPSSALSTTVVLTGANPSGGDFLSEQDRHSDPKAYSQSYVSSSKARTGIFPVKVTFYAGAGATGAVVGVAQRTVTILSDGSGIGDISVSNTITAVSLGSALTLAPGQTSQLAFDPMDAQGHTVVVSPGSEHWNLVSGSSAISLSDSGLVTANAAGTATVTVTVDGVTSSAQTITVSEPAEFANGGFETPALNVHEWKQDVDLVGSQWTGDPHHGIANGSGSWGTNGHNSAQYAYLQASTVTPSHGSVEQTIDNLVAGETYKVTFWIARRSGNVGGNTGAPISLFANGVLIAGPTSPTGDGSWTQVTSSAFTANQASYHFKFQVSLPGGVADTTTLLDDVHLASQ